MSDAAKPPRTAPPRKPRNEDVRGREYLTSDEVDQLRRSAASLGRRGDRVRRYPSDDRPPRTVLGPLARGYRPVKRQAHPRPGRPHLVVPARPRVGALGAVPLVVADFRLRVVRLVPAGRVGFLVEAQIAAGLGARAVDAGGRAVESW